MQENSYLYIWRCAKCTNHFANINKMDGMIKQEKKCPKCKSLNQLTLTDKEIFIHCKLFDQKINSYGEEINESYAHRQIPDYP